MAVRIWIGPATSPTYELEDETRAAFNPAGVTIKPLEDNVGREVERFYPWHNVSHIDRDYVADAGPLFAWA
jgi:hypothetical protein